MAAEEPSSLLVIIVDLNPLWWGKKVVKQDVETVLTQYLDSIMVFSNAHLMLNHKNKLAILATHKETSPYLFILNNDSDQQTSEEGSDDPNSQTGKDGKFELFARVNNGVMEQIKEVFLLDNTVSPVSTDSLIAGAMCKALCYINRLEKEATFGETISSRMLIIKGAEDNPSQYMNFMNVVFTAQKQNVVIDACLIQNDSGLLQQACDITGGMYLKIAQTSGLLQYLLWVYLPDPSMRDTLSLPPKVQVDFRAACFCHRNLIDIGYVCSVCLSIFCVFTPICSTCQTKFKIKGPAKLKRKVKKTS